MGHFDHGLSLAFPNQVLRYGFRTINGSTGGVSREASAIAELNAMSIQHAHAGKSRSHCMTPASPGRMYQQGVKVYWDQIPADQETIRKGSGLAIPILWDAVLIYEMLSRQ